MCNIFCILDTLTVPTIFSQKETNFSGKPIHTEKTKGKELIEEEDETKGTSTKKYNSNGQKGDIDI